MSSNTLIFSPTKLTRARERVAANHTIKLSTVHQEPAALSQLMARLIDALKRSDGSDAALRRLIARMSAVERKLFSGLLWLSDEEVLIKHVISCARLDKTLIDTSTLWRAHCHEFGRAHASSLSILLLTQRFDELTTSQVSLLRALYHTNEPPRAVLEKIWEAAATRRERLPQLLEALICPQGSALASALGDGLLTSASERARLLHEPAQLLEILNELPVNRQLVAFAQTWQLHRGQPTLALAQREHVIVFLSAYYAAAHYEEQLKQALPEAASWYEALRIALDLASFFQAAPDNERFEFWQRYLPYMRKIHGDLKSLRLFIDFGTFGVVEFAEVGNASYLYRPKDFAACMSLGQREPHRPHGDFKDKLRAIATLNHSSGWQRRFAAELRELLSPR